MTIPTMTLSINGLTQSDQSPSDITVRGFRGGEAINNSFRFTVWFSTSSAISASDAASVTGNAASLTVTGTDTTLSVPGRLFELGGGDTWQVGTYYYYAVIRPEFDLLKFNSRTRAFADDSGYAILDFLKSEVGVFNTSGTTVSTDGSAQSLKASFLSETEPQVPFDFVMQYQESDYSFVNRLCERFGIAYTFDDSDGSIKFFDSTSGYTVADASGGAGPEELLELSVDNTQRGTFDANQCLYSFRMQFRPGAYTFTSKDYRWESASTSSPYGIQESTEDLASPAVGYGTMIEYGDNYHTVTVNDDDARFGEIMKERSMSETIMFKGGSNSLHLRPGVMFRVNHHNSELSGNYVIVDIQHYCQSNNVKTRFSEENELPNSIIDGSETSLDYYNEFYAVPSSQFYIAPKTTAVPKISGVVSGKIASSDNTTPGNTADGCYKVQLLLDEAVPSDGTASTLDIRLAEPFGGPATGASKPTGFHFPLQDDTEVLVAFIDGNPDRPVIVGTVANGANASVAEDATTQVNRIRTASNALFEISDA